MSDTTAAGILIGMMVTYVFVLIAWYIVNIIAYWKIFTKAGEAGWKSIIPIYSGFIQYRISWNTTMFWGFFACMIVGSLLSNMDGFIGTLGLIVMAAASVINLMSLHKLSRAFGHGIGFTLGLIFLNPVFMLILGFGGSEYQGAQN